MAPIPQPPGGGKGKGKPVRVILPFGNHLPKGKYEGSGEKAGEKDIKSGGPPHGVFGSELDFKNWRQETDALHQLFDAWNEEDKHPQTGRKAERDMLAVENDRIAHKLRKQNENKPKPERGHLEKQQPYGKEKQQATPKGDPSDPREQSVSDRLKNDPHIQFLNETHRAAQDEHDADTRTDAEKRADYYRAMGQHPEVLPDNPDYKAPIYDSKGNVYTYRHDGTWRDERGVMHHHDLQKLADENIRLENERNQKKPKGDSSDPRDSVSGKRSEPSPFGDGEPGHYDENGDWVGHGVQPNERPGGPPYRVDALGQKYYQEPDGTWRNKYNQEHPDDVEPDDIPFAKKVGDSPKTPPAQRRGTGLPRVGGITGTPKPKPKPKAPPKIPPVPGQKAPPKRPPIPPYTPPGEKKPIMTRRTGLSNYAKQVP